MKQPALTRAQREVTMDVLAHIDARQRGVNRLGDAVACLRQTLDAWRRRANSRPAGME